MRMTRAEDLRRLEGDRGAALLDRAGGLGAGRRAGPLAVAPVLVWQRVDDVDAGAVEGGEERGEARERGEFAQDPADQRQAQLQGVQAGAQGSSGRARGRRAPCRRACEQHRPAPVAHRPGQSHQDARLQRQALAGAAQQALELGHHVDEGDHDRGQQHRGDDGRIDRDAGAWLASSSCASAAPMSRIASGEAPACSPARSRLTATAEKASGWRAAAPDSGRSALDVGDQRRSPAAAAARRRRRAARPGSKGGTPAARSCSRW